MNKKVLLVEDDFMIRELYKEILTSEGFIVETAVDGEEAYKRMSQENWDIVLLDIVLPKLSGLELLKRLHGQGPHSNIKKTIFLTNIDNPTELEEAKKLSDDIIVKSKVNPDELIKRIKLTIL